MQRLRSNKAISLAVRLCCEQHSACTAGLSEGLPAAASLLTLHFQHATFWSCSRQPWPAGLEPGFHQQSQLQQLHQQQLLGPQALPRKLHWLQPSSSSSCTSRHLWSSAACSSNDSSSSSSSDGTIPSDGTPAARPRDMAIVFTCAKCDTRAVKAFTRQAYEAGLVLINCPGCQSMHLIADHLGWFGDSAFKIDEYMAAQGQAVKRVSITTPGAAAEQLTAEDMAGWSKVQQLLSTVAAASSSKSEQQGGGCCGGSGAGSDGSSHSHSSSSGSSSATENGASTSSSSAATGSDSPAAGSSSSSSVEQSAALLMREGVVDVAPADVEAWVRVQQQQQQQQQQ